MNQADFLRRLEGGGWAHFTELIPWTDGTRVYAVSGAEIWVVDFFADGEIEVDLYRLDEEGASNSGAPPELERFFLRRSEAWSEAAADLGVRFECPYELRTAEGVAHMCTGLVPDFGGPNGTLILSREEPAEVAMLGEAQGFNVPGLNPRYYDRYDRSRFVEALSDWGWYGQSQPPEWLLHNRSR